MHVALRVSFASLTVLAATVTLAAFQAGSPQQPQASKEAPKEVQYVGVPQWPYPQEPPKGSIPPDDGQLHHLPGSTKEYTLKQADGTLSVDWFPEAHPKAPIAVTDGKPGSYFSCGSCHLMNGNGLPETQSLNGLPAAYMKQQFEDFKKGLRHTSLGIRLDVHMIHVAERLSDAEANEAFAYFQSVGPAQWVRVVETETVPKTMPGTNDIGIADIDPGGAKEPIGNRIVELPVSYERTLLHDPTSGFVAYVPHGSIAKGKVLVDTGAGGRTFGCAVCHGTDLRGGMSGTAPPIPGRSPIATARQLYDFKTGARHGTNSTMMKPVVNNLTDEDIVDISAYLASLPQ